MPHYDHNEPRPEQPSHSDYYVPQYNVCVDRCEAAKLKFENDPEASHEAICTNFCERFVGCFNAVMPHVAGPCEEFGPCLPKEVGEGTSNDFMCGPGFTPAPFGECLRSQRAGTAAPRPRRGEVAASIAC